MNVKVTMPGEQADRKYPYIGRFFGGKTVVLFYGPRKGNEIIDSQGQLVSHSRLLESWLEEDFTPLPPGSTIMVVE